MTKLPVWRRLAWRLGASFLLLTAVAILLSGFLQYRAQAQWLRESLGSLLLNIARTGSLLVDGDLHQAVVAAARSDTPEYARLRHELVRIQETNQLGDAVYTLTDVAGATARFAVISNGLAPIGLEYKLAPEIQPILRRVLTEGIPAYTGIYKSSSGTWITAFAPVKNSAGQTVAALDVDFRVDVYLGELAAVRRRLYLHSLAGAVLALVAGVMLARQITRPVVQLSSLARGVVEGHFSTKVRIAARDEIGMLGGVLHLMAERLNVSHRSMTEVLVRALEARGEASGSLRRLARASALVAEHLELSPTQRESLELGALLHDIGEIRVPEAVLQKPAPLAPDEQEILRRHPEWGVELLETVPLLTPALDVVGGHHERYDGSGYPHGLTGETIPLTARIFAVADALNAMTHDRPYRPARPIAEALHVLRANAGKQFDPRVVDAALEIPLDRWADALALTGYRTLEVTTMPTMRQAQTAMSESVPNAGETRSGAQSRAGWFGAVAPLWPLALARILYGYLWWQQSAWKVPSDDFGRKSGGGLWYWVHQQIQYPTLAAHKAFLVNVVIPHWTFFGWIALIGETFIGTTLILGLGTRLGSLVAIGMAVNITMGILNVPHEWGWTYTMLIMFPVVFLLTDAGRSFGVDAFLAPRLDRAAANGSRVARLIRWLV